MATTATAPTIKSIMAPDLAAVRVIDRREALAAYHANRATAPRPVGVPDRPLTAFEKYGSGK